MPSETNSQTVRRVGRYLLHREIASGGMASVHLGRMVGAVGFAKTVAIKRLHPQFAKDPDFVRMFLDEARLAARIQHPNVVSVLDVVEIEEEIYLVMEYVQGESLARLLSLSQQQEEPLPARYAATIVCGALHGLHAAHEAKSETGMPLEIVHRDVSPQNILLGAEGVPRVVDFGVAKAANRLQSTRDGQLKGKLAYMAPEQLQCDPVDRRADVYAASVVLWELLTGRRLFSAQEPGALVLQILDHKIEAPSSVRPTVPEVLDQIVLRGLSLQPEDRFQTAQEMAYCLEYVLPSVPPSQLGIWVTSLAADSLAKRAQLVAEVESSSSVDQSLPKEVLAALRGRAAANSPAPRATPLDSDQQAAAPKPPAERLLRSEDSSAQALSQSLVGVQNRKPENTLSLRKLLLFCGLGAVAALTAVLGLSALAKAPPKHSEAIPAPAVSDSALGGPQNTLSSAQQVEPSLADVEAAGIDAATPAACASPVATTPPRIPPKGPGKSGPHAVPPSTGKSSGFSFDDLKRK